jgi:hypothetical protein
VSAGGDVSVGGGEIAGSAGRGVSVGGREGAVGIVAGALAALAAPQAATPNATPIMPIHISRLWSELLLEREAGGNE